MGVRSMGILRGIVQRGGEGRLIMEGEVGTGGIIMIGIIGIAGIIEIRGTTGEMIGTEEVTGEDIDRYVAEFI